MRRSVLLVGLTILVAGVTSLGGASGAARLASAGTVTFGGSIAELKADGGRAIVLIKLTGSDRNVVERCADIFVWRPATWKVVTVVDHRDVTVDHRPCLGMDYLGSYSGVALAGTDAAWVQSSGGNIYETLMFAKSLATGSRGQIGGDAAGGQGYSGGFVGNAHGDGALLVYNNYSVCRKDEYADVQCPPGYKDGSISADQIVMARPDQRTVATSDSALTVLSVGRGRIVARRATGPLIVLAPKRAKAQSVVHAGFSAERLIATYPYKPGEVRAAVTDGRTLAVLRAGALDVIPLPGSSGTRTTRVLPRAASYGADPPVSCIKGSSWRCTTPSFGSSTSTATLPSTSAVTPSTCSTSPAAAASSSPDPRPRPSAHNWNPTASTSPPDRPSPSPHAASSNSDCTADTPRSRAATRAPRCGGATHHGRACPRGGRSNSLRCSRV